PSTFLFGLCVDARDKPGMTQGDLARSPDARQARSGMTRFRASLLGLAEILDGLEDLELDIVELAVGLRPCDPADIDILDDVACLRIDRDRAARALPLLTLHGFHQLGAVGVAARLLQGFVDQVNA